MPTTVVDFPSQVQDTTPTFLVMLFTVPDSTI